MQGEKLIEEIAKAAGVPVDAVSVRMEDGDVIVSIQSWKLDKDIVDVDSCVDRVQDVINESFDKATSLVKGLVNEDSGRTEEGEEAP